MLNIHSKTCLGCGMLREDWNLRNRISFRQKLVKRKSTLRLRIEMLREDFQICYYRITKTSSKIVCFSSQLQSYETCVFWALDMKATNIAF
jgi:hypothetical protein